MKGVAEFCKAEPEISGLNAGALKPLMRERDDVVREAAIQKISEDTIGKQHAGRGHKKKLTAKDVKEVIQKEEEAISHVENVLSVIDAITPTSYHFLAGFEFA